MTKTRRSLGLAMMLMVLWPALVPAASPATERGPKPRPVVADDTKNARVIVKYRNGSGLMRVAAAGTTALPLHAQTMGARLGLALQDGRVLGARTQALRSPGMASADLVQRLAAQPDVEWAVVDHRRGIHAVAPNDPYYGPGQTSITPTVGQWYLRAPDATLVSATNAIGAWATSTGSSAVTVAVIDTGVRFDHPDLAGKLYPGYDFVSATDNNSGDSDADASDPGDADPTCSPTSSWHGTQVSGLVAAASNNRIGMAGSGRDVMLLPVRALGKCGGYDSDIIAAMRWAGGITDLPVANPHPAQVLNMSLGSTGACEQSYIDTIAELTAAKVSVVVAAGNESGAAVGTPANCPGAIAVAGLRHTGTKVGYSNLGPEIVVSAPAGNCVNINGGPCLYPLLTTINLGATAPGANGYSDSSNSSLGTSFSAPLVAGTVALMLSVDNTLTPAAIRALLQSSARPFPSTGADAGVRACKAPNAVDQIECYCTTTTCGAGMLDAGAALAALTPAAGLPPTGDIAPSSTAPTAGETVTLSGAGSTAVGGRSIVSYDWAIVSGASHAAFIGASNGSTVSLATQSAGSVLVQLTATDSGGASNSKIVLLTVQAVPGVTPPAAASSGGGGASSALWLALLTLASFSLRRAGSAQRRR
jgi:serine protease